MRARLIYNPTSGREQLSQNLADLLDIYERAGYETSAFRTTAEPKSAEKEAERAARQGFDLIIAAGGDGTVHEVVNGISRLDQRPRVAVIPGGTSNDYAHALGVTRNDVLQAARTIEKGEFVPMDIGFARTAYHQQTFVNIAALGTMTELTFKVSPALKSTFGYLAYFAKGAEMLPQMTQPSHLRISYDHGMYEGLCTAVFVTLTETFGGFSSVAPDSVPGDGKFTLIIIKTNKLLKIANLLIKLLNKGQHIDDEDIIYAKSSRVYIETLDEEELMVNLDGEEGGLAPVEFINLQQHIEFVGDADLMTHSIDPRDDHTAQLKADFIQAVQAYREKEGES